jgi:hypothetical protein
MMSYGNGYMTERDQDPSPERRTDSDYMAEIDRMCEAMGLEATPEMREIREFVASAYRCGAIEEARRLAGVYHTKGQEVVSDRLGGQSGHEWALAQMALGGSKALLWWHAGDSERFWGEVEDAEMYAQGIGGDVEAVERLVDRLYQLPPPQ